MVAAPWRILRLQSIESALLDREWRQKKEIERNLDSGRKIQLSQAYTSQANDSRAIAIEMTALGLLPHFLPRVGFWLRRPPVPAGRARGWRVARIASSGMPATRGEPCKSFGTCGGSGIRSGRRGPSRCLPCQQSRCPSLWAADSPDNNCESDARRRHTR